MDYYYVFSKSFMKKLFLFFWEFTQIVLISLIIIIPIRYYVVQPFFVKGSSMEPNFQDRDYLIIDELSYHLREPQRGEVVIFKFPKNTKQFYIKRIIGLPGETITINDNQVVITNSENPNGFVLNESTYIQSVTPGKDIHMTLEEEEYFVMGDNRMHSFDSRNWGKLADKYLIGRVLFRVWPFEEAMAFSLPEYQVVNN